MDDGTSKGPVQGIDTPASAKTTSVISFILQAASGICILIPLYVLFAGFGWVPRSSSAVVLIVFAAFPFLNLIWAGLCLAVAIFGTRQSMPGVAWSPVIFCMVWCSASIAHRASLAMQAKEAPDISLEIAAIPKDFRERNLILLGSGEPCCWYLKALSERQVAAVVKGDPRILDEQSFKLSVTTHAEGESCLKEKFLSGITGNSDLKAVGRTDDCFLGSWTSTVPDGVIIRTRGTNGPEYTTDVLVRENGRDRVVADFGKRGGRTLSYLPFIGSGRSRASGIWSFVVGGPFQDVGIGPGQSVEHHLAAALFGESVFTPIAPKYDLRSPEILAEAEKILMRRDKLTALRLVTLARDAGNVGEATYTVMAAQVCDDSEVFDHSYWSFVRTRTEDQSAILLRKVFALARDPTHAKDRQICRGLQPSPGSHRTEFDALAWTILRQKDLGTWQYDYAIGFLRCYGQEKVRNCQSPTQRQVAQVVFADDDPITLSHRAIAYARHYREFSDDDIRGFTRGLRVVPDSDLEEFASSIKIRTLAQKNEAVPLDSTAADLRRAADERLSGIQDPDRRKKLQIYM